MSSLLYTWTNTQKVLEELAPAMLSEYKRLGNTENVSVTVGDLEVTLHLPPYAQYIEYGRKAGKFPPLGAIETWMTVKNIVPRENSTVPQVSYLIARKIAREGTQGKYAAQGTLDLFENTYLPKIYSAIVQDVINNLKHVVNGFSN